MEEEEMIVEEILNGLVKILNADQLAALRDKIELTLIEAELFQHIQSS